MGGRPRGGPRAAPGGRGDPAAGHVAGGGRPLAVPARARAHPGQRDGVERERGRRLSLADVRPVPVPLHPTLGPAGRVSRPPAELVARGRCSHSRSLRRRRDLPGDPLRRPAPRRVVPRIEPGSVTLRGLQPDTAGATRGIVGVLIWVFALTVAYQYIPGSESDAFKAVGVFAGLMISLGSAGLVNQVMSGLVMVYARALRPGELVRAGEVIGVVSEVSLLSTKVVTPKREEVTIPNAVLAGTMITNYSRLADENGAIISTAVTIGYDAPWRQVHALLLLAAERTPGVLKHPRPHVLQTALSDFYPAVRAARAHPERRVDSPALSDLHARSRTPSTSSACRSCPRTSRRSPSARRCAEVTVVRGPRRPSEGRRAAARRAPGRAGHRRARLTAPGPSRDRCGRPVNAFAVRLARAQAGADPVLLADLVATAGRNAHQVSAERLAPDQAGPAGGSSTGLDSLGRIAILVRDFRPGDRRHADEIARARLPPDEAGLARGHGAERGAPGRRARREPPGGVTGTGDGRLDMAHVVDGLAKAGILLEQAAAVVLREPELEVLVADEVAGKVDGLEARHVGQVPEARPHPERRVLAKEVGVVVPVQLDPVALVPQEVVGIDRFEAHRACVTRQPRADEEGDILGIQLAADRGQLAEPVPMPDVALADVERLERGRQPE